MLAFDDRLHGPRWMSRRLRVESVTRAKAVDPPRVRAPVFSGVVGGPAESSGVGGVT
jgi:hypothetical protein